MRRRCITTITLSVACAALVLALGEAPVVAQGPPAAPDSKPETPPSPSEAESAKPQGETGKPDQANPTPEPESAKPAASEAEAALLPLAELLREGFEIRGTDFIPAEAVTRQSGKVSSDAIAVTLQKTGSTAICFYTLKAYVSKKLTTIPACTVRR